jgi:two-component system chemotaxis response regulator CheB
LKSSSKKYKAVVIGVSAGGMKALKILLKDLPQDFQLPIIIVQHISPDSDSIWISLLEKNGSIKMKEADEKEKIENGVVYFAPPNYHLLIERDYTFSLSADKRVNFARPSVDILFESAANAYGSELIGMILTGANNDGASGLKKIKDMGGLTIVQDPTSAEARFMPEAAIEEVQTVDYILPLEKIKTVLIKLAKNNVSSYAK